jgi:hypothetical protein
VILPPSGAWAGYYLYGSDGVKHRMKLSLTFTPDGKILGDGIDDIALFTIDGVFDAPTNEAAWTKSYLGMHSVEYRGLYNQRSISGNWTISIATGGFMIWPDALEEKESSEAEAEVEQPAELVLA